jgi:biotin carboxylase
MSLRLMQAAVAKSASGTAPMPMVGKELEALIIRSLGPPQSYAVGVDKSLLQPVLQRAGVRIPEFTVAQTPQDAARFARELGGATFVKPSDGVGSRDVIECDTPQAAEAAARRVQAGFKLGAIRGAQPTVLIQRRIVGHMLPRTSVAYDGIELAGFARERVHAIAPGRGSTVVRYVHAPQPAQFSRAIAATLHLTGFFAVEYCVEQSSGDAYLIDFSRRMAPSTHTGSMVGVDLCAALAAALRGEAVTPRDIPAGSSRMMTLFPQEVWRDPCSPALHQYPMDVPWDDPPLWLALSGWRYEADG